MEKIAQLSSSSREISSLIQLNTYERTVFVAEDEIKIIPIRVKIKPLYLIEGNLDEVSKYTTNYLRASLWKVVEGNKIRNLAEDNSLFQFDSFPPSSQIASDKVGSSFTLFVSIPSDVFLPGEGFQVLLEIKASCPLKETIFGASPIIKVAHYKIEVSSEFIENRSMRLEESTSSKLDRRVWTKNRRQRCPMKVTVSLRDRNKKSVVPIRPIQVKASLAYRSENIFPPEYPFFQSKTVNELLFEPMKGTSHLLTLTPQEPEKTFAFHINESSTYHPEPFAIKISSTSYEGNNEKCIMVHPAKLNEDIVVVSRSQLLGKIPTTLVHLFQYEESQIEENNDIESLTQNKVEKKLRIHIPDDKQGLSAIVTPHISGIDLTAEESIVELFGNDIVGFFI